MVQRGRAAVTSGGRAEVIAASRAYHWAVGSLNGAALTNALVPASVSSTAANARVNPPPALRAAETGEPRCELIALRTLSGRTDHSGRTAVAPYGTSGRVIGRMTPSCPPGAAENVRGHWQD